jgi:hypothetical protein
MTYNEWIDTLIDEKGYDVNDIILEKEGSSGLNIIELGAVIDQIKACALKERKAIRNMIVRIDFANGNVLHYFKHLANAMVR